MLIPSTATPLMIHTRASIRAPPTIAGSVVREDAGTLRPDPVTRRYSSRNGYAGKFA
jgi:hypothetical protein